MNVEINDDAGWGAWAQGSEMTDETPENEFKDEGEEKDGQDPPGKTTDEVDPQKAAQDALDERFKQLEAQAKNTPETQQAPAPKPTAPLIDPEQLKALEADFPELYKTFLAQNTALETLHKTVGELTQREAERQAEEALLVAKAVQAEIEAIPQLDHWQKNSPEIFAQAVEIDDLLKKAQPKLSMKERFAKVASAVEAIHGNPLPESQQKKPSIPKAKPSFVGLGDLPTGEPMAGKEASENASVTDLYSTWWGKSEAELEAAWKQSA